MFRRMRRTSVNLTPRQVEALDDLAADEGVSRSALIRRLVDLAAIDLSFGALAVADVDLVGRGPGAREEHLTRVRG